jgi:hypothetical protein
LEIPLVAICMIWRIWHRKILLKETWGQYIHKKGRARARLNECSWIFRLVNLAGSQ